MSACFLACSDGRSHPKDFTISRVQSAQIDTGTTSSCCPRQSYPNIWLQRHSKGLKPKHTVTATHKRRRSAVDDPGFVYKGHSVHYVTSSSQTHMALKLVCRAIQRVIQSTYYSQDLHCRSEAVLACSEKKLELKI